MKEEGQNEGWVGASGEERKGMTWPLKVSACACYTIVYS